MRRQGLLFFLLTFGTLAHAQSLTYSWTPDAVTLSAGTNAIGYNLHLGPSSGNYTTVYNAGNVSQFTVPNLVAGQTYYAVVRAYNSAGTEGPSSNEVVASPTPVPTPTPSPTPKPSATPTPTPTPIPTPVPTPTPTPVPSPTPTPIPTPTPSGGLITIGATAVFGQLDSGNAGLICSQSAVLSQAATIQSLSFYVVDPAGTLQLAIYSSNSGGPGALLAYTSTFTPVAGWNTVPVTNPTLLQPGTYWLAYLSNNNGLSFEKTTATGSAAWADATSLASAFPSDPTTATVEWSFYATLSTAAATPTPTPTPTPVPTPTPTPIPTPTPAETYVGWTNQMNAFISANDPTAAQLLAWINANPPTPDP